MANDLIVWCGKPTHLVLETALSPKADKTPCVQPGSNISVFLLEDTKKYTEQQRSWVERGARLARYCHRAAGALRPGAVFPPEGRMGDGNKKPFLPVSQSLGVCRLFLTRGFLENLTLLKKAFGNTQGSLVQTPYGSSWIPAGWQGLPRAPPLHGLVEACL